MKLNIFPLTQVLLYPSFSKPFHVSNPNYIAMINDSLVTGTPIAIASVFDGQVNTNYNVGEKLNFVRDIVGFGHPIIVEKHPDGSLVIFLEGKGKARLGKVMASVNAYITCEAEKIDESTDVLEQNFKGFLSVQKVMINWLNNHILDDMARSQFLNYIKTPDQVIGCYASYLIADHDLQQLLLESNDINEKINLLQRMIASGDLVA